MVLINVTAEQNCVHQYWSSPSISSPINAFTYWIVDNKYGGFACWLDEWIFMKIISSLRSYGKDKISNLLLSQHKSILESNHLLMGFDLRTFARDSLCLLYSWNGKKVIQINSSDRFLHWSFVETKYWCLPNNTLYFLTWCFVRRDIRDLLLSKWPGRFNPEGFWYSKSVVRWCYDWRQLSNVLMQDSRDWNNKIYYWQTILIKEENGFGWY